MARGFLVGQGKFIMKPSQILRENDWCRGLLARDKNGKKVSFNDTKACSFCLMGALDRSCWDGHKLDYEQMNIYFKKVSDALEKRGYPHNIPAANDNYVKNKEEAIAILEEAGL